MSAGERSKKVEDEESEEMAAARRPRRPSSPEPVCSICLSDLENMSCTNSCLHKFCFTCLLEWSKVKPECPLCKSKFTSIIHTIVSDDRYESYTLPERPPPAPQPAVIPLDPSEVERFRYGSTLTGERIRARHLHRQLMAELALPTMQHGQQLPPLPFPPSLQLPSGAGGSITTGPMWRRRRGRATSEFRRDVYERSLYVDPDSVVDVTGRFRECSPEWFRNNEASTHRLVPWLNRELCVLLINGSQQSSYVMQLILDTLQRQQITGPEFLELLQPYLGTRTEHFQHEFYHYARSVYDMVGFDRHAVYTERREQQAAVAPTAAANRETVMVISSSSSDDDDDIVVLDEITHGGASGALAAAAQAAAALMGESPPSAPPSSAASDRRDALNSLTERIRQRLESNGGILNSRIPFPPAQNVQETPTSTPSEGEGPATPPLPPAFDGPSTSSGETSSNFQRLVIPDDDSDSDGSAIDVVYEKQGSKRLPMTPPPRPASSPGRIPEIVNLSSDEDPVVREHEKVAPLRLRIPQVSPEEASEGSERDEDDSSGRDRDRGGGESAKRVDSRRRSKNQRQMRKEIEIRRSGAPNSGSGNSSSEWDEDGEDGGSAVLRSDERRKRRASRKKKKRRCSESKKASRSKSRGKELKGKGKGKRSTPRKKEPSSEEEGGQSTPLVSDEEEDSIENMMMNSTLGDDDTDTETEGCKDSGSSGRRGRLRRKPGRRPSPELSRQQRPSPPPSSRKRPITDGSGLDEDDDVPLSKRFYQQGRLKSRIARKRKVELIPVKEEPLRVKEEKDAYAALLDEEEEERESKGDLRALLLRRKKRKLCKEEPRPTPPSPSPPSVELAPKMLEPVMSMHVEDDPAQDMSRDEMEAELDFEVWRLRLIAKKKKKMTME